MATLTSIWGLKLVCMFFKVTHASLYYRANFRASSFILMDFIVGVKVIPFTALMVMTIHLLPQR